MATLTPVSHLRCQERWEFEGSLVTHRADRDAHLQMDSLLLLPTGPLPSRFSQTRVELEGMHCMVEGGELGVVSLLSGFSRIVAGFEAHLLWSVLISFNFLSFCGIKVLLLLLRRVSEVAPAFHALPGARAQRHPENPSASAW